jgi:hypothetical protein
LWVGLALLGGSGLFVLFVVAKGRQKPEEKKSTLTRVGGW